MGTSDEGTGVEINASFRLSDGRLEFICPLTWRFQGETMWREPARDWTSVDVLTADIEHELSKAQS